MPGTGRDEQRSLGAEGGLRVGFRSGRAEVGRGGRDPCGGYLERLRTVIVHSMTISIATLLLLSQD